MINLPGLPHATHLHRLGITRFLWTDKWHFGVHVWSLVLWKDIWNVTLVRSKSTHEPANSLLWLITLLMFSIFIFYGFDQLLNSVGQFVERPTCSANVDFEMRWIFEIFTVHRFFVFLPVILNLVNSLTLEEVRRRFCLEGQALHLLFYTTW